MIVSSSGSPAATSEPKARSRISRVTGQEKSSDFSIASLLASLKSDHMPAAPVRLASTPGAATPATSDFSSPAAATIAFGSLAAVARRTAVCPSREIETPGRGGTTLATAASAARVRSTAARVRRKRGSSASAAASGPPPAARRRRRRRIRRRPACGPRPTPSRALPSRRRRGRSLPGGRGSRGRRRAAPRSRRQCRGGWRRGAPIARSVRVSPSLRCRQSSNSPIYPFTATQLNSCTRYNNTAMAIASKKKKVTSPLNPQAAELIARRFRALADPTRLRILDHLRNHEEASVGEITETLGASQQNVSKHLAALLRRGLRRPPQARHQHPLPDRRPRRPRNLRWRHRRHRDPADRARGGLRQLEVDFTR